MYLVYKVVDKDIQHTDYLLRQWPINGRAQGPGGKLYLDLEYM